MKIEDFIKKSDYIVGKFLLWYENDVFDWFNITRVDDIEVNGLHLEEFIVKGPSVTWNLKEFKLGYYKFPSTPLTYYSTFFSYKDNPPKVLIGDYSVILRIVFNALRNQGATEDIINHYKSVFN